MAADEGHLRQGGVAEQSIAEQSVRPSRTAARTRPALVELNTALVELEGGASAASVCLDPLRRERTLALFGRRGRGEPPRARTTAAAIPSAVPSTALAPRARAAATAATAAAIPSTDRTARERRPGPRAVRGEALREPGRRLDCALEHGAVLSARFTRGADEHAADLIALPLQGALLQLPLTRGRLACTPRLRLL